MLLRIGRSALLAEPTINLTNASDASPGAGQTTAYRRHYCAVIKQIGVGLGRIVQT